MKNILKLLAFISLLTFTACEDVFTPALENTRGIDAMYNEPLYAQGILANAYILLPYSSSPTSDVATDDAVSNDNTNTYRLMATGSWTASNNPASQWQSRKNAIQYLNIFLENADQVVWSKDEVVRRLYNNRLKGEAYGLRALQLYYLLLAHGGWTSDGKLLGVPIVTKPESAGSDFNLPRNTFQECILQIYKDANQAIELLPLDYGDITDDALIPDKFKAMGVTRSGDYSRVNGDRMKGRITGRIVEAVRSQAALLAASPAYSAGTSVTWENAADYAATVLDRINGVSGMSSTGGTWYANTTEINALASGANPAEIIWRSDKTNATDGLGLELEKNNYPPSLYGNGRVNPTQNLVDAFPMANGFPITVSQSGYSANNPYANRDPRLTSYIVVNESKQGPSNNVIVTGTYGTNNDAINKEIGLSTRTGYYLRKLLRPDCNPNPQYNTAQYHYAARIRYTEIFLNYAEAANEAWGPTGRGSHSYSAYDVIKAIRMRAGVGTTGDSFLESIKGDKEKMRELIRNERRLELCFENFRFWDLRRWKVNLNETANGLQIDKNTDGTLKFTPLNVENRLYKDYMFYGPIPYDETRKWSNLQQNVGW
ncbi:MAG: RagB/SusD family nutrient uptake outer membrane protein [Paludibacteraceae bacterium]